MVKRLSTMQETWVQSLGWEDSLKKEMATHFRTLAQKIPWTEEPGAGYCPWGCKESDMTEELHFHFFTNNETIKALRSEVTFLRFGQFVQIEIQDHTF